MRSRSACGIRRLPHDPRLRLLGRYRHLDIWLVDGELIREHHIDFTMGGSDQRYFFISPYEIWVEKILSTRDRFATILHEINERQKMARGQTYDTAHDFAHARERLFRKKFPYRSRTHISY